LLLMAEKGEEGLQEFIRRHAKDDSRIAQKIAKLRAKLEEEAEDLRRRLTSEYADRRKAERAKAEALMDRLRRQEDDLDARRGRLDRSLPDEIMARMRQVPVIELAIQTPTHVPWWRRAMARLRRLWTRFKRWLRRLVGRARPEPKARGLVIGVGGGPGVEIDMDIEQALALNPGFRRRIRRGMGATSWARGRRMVRILLGLEDYADVARQVMEREAERAARERHAQLDRQRNDLTERRSGLSREEAEARASMEKEVERLRQAEADEALKLEEVLAHEPEDSAQRMVADELEAGGFLNKIGDTWAVTGRFLETVAGLVYAQESQGLAPSHESPVGASIEGEGILDKTPLYSHAEASHMDVVGSIVQARQRHPHVRHLTEDDILVYRERRTSVAHVVVVLDRSLSMEENQRMTAAKRAALALWWATKKKGSENHIDFVLMDTHVERASLADCWEAEPRGFTNTGRALEVGRRILERARANRRVLFLVTDGLPEAMTVEGKDVAGRPEEALKYALAQAGQLARVPGLEFRILLLEPDDPMFVTAAQKIAAKGRGTVHEVDPADLARSLLRGFAEAPSQLA
jgi:Mg-chelatase subunit ChlD